MARRNFWDRHAKRFDPQPSGSDEAVERAKPWLEPDDGVLEVGCATGATARALRPRVGSWHAIDISAEMIHRANEAGGDITFEQAELEAASLDGRSFDAVVCFNVLHFLDLPAATRRIHELLRPGGLLIAQTPCLGDLGAPARAGIRIVARVMRLEGLHHLRFDTLQRSVAQSFDIVEADAARPSQTWLVARRGAAPSGSA